MDNNLDHTKDKVMAMTYEVTEQRILSGKLTSHALVAGSRDKPPLLLMHGAGPGANAATNWRHVMPDLAEKFYVVAPDMAGFGQTDCPDPVPAHIMGWMGARVEQMLGLMDALEIEKAHIVGNSMGGALTLQLLTEAPTRFDRVALMGSIGGPATPTAELIRLTAFYADPRPSRYREIMHSFAYDSDTFEGMNEIIAERYKMAMDPKIRAIQEKMIDAMRAGMDALVMPPHLLGKLPHPVLIFHGRQDRVVPLEPSLYLLKHLQRAELLVLDRCGHWAQLQRWDLMRPMLERHLGVTG